MCFHTYESNIRSFYSLLYFRFPGGKGIAQLTEMQFVINSFCMIGFRFVSYKFFYLCINYLCKNTISRQIQPYAFKMDYQLLI